MKKIKIGIIGCGTIGSRLAKVLLSEFRSKAEVRYLCDHHRIKAEKLVRELRRPLDIVSIDELIRHSDLIVETASASISGYVAEQALERNKKVLIMSVGGLLDSRKLTGLLKRTRGALWVPSGALAGVDALLAGREDGIHSVRLVTTKSPEALSHAPYFKNRNFPKLKGSQPVRIFRGTAFQAVKAFPQNINVAAVLSLAGLGANKTQIEIWTARNMRKNQHEVMIEGSFGKIYTRVENVPSPDNPKTSYLAFLSAVATLRKIFSAVQIGT